MKYGTRAEKPVVFSLRNRLSSPYDKLVAPALDRIVGCHGLNAVYQAALQQDQRLAFADKVLAVMGVRYEVDPRDLERVPREGSLIAAANHCFGILEGLVLASIFGAIRPDMKILVNGLLEGIPELRPIALFVNPFGGEAAARRNVRPLKEAMRHLRAGRTIGVFPSGAVAHLEWGRRGLVEPPWSPAVGMLVRHARATAIPVFFDGANSLYFYLAGLLHPLLRTVLLVRQFLNKRKTVIRVRIGQPIPFSRLEGQDRIADHLRLCAYNLGRRAAVYSTGFRPCRVPGARRRARRNEPIIAPLSDEVLARDMAALAPDRRLVEAGEMEVWIARAPDIPGVLREIGRLREVVFRAAGGGTGKSVDLDGCL